MVRCLIYAFFVCVFFMSSVDVYAFLKSTKFTVIVVDENGEPLPGVEVGVGFERNSGGGTNSVGQNGISGSDGKLTFLGQSNGHITYGGHMEGYYPSNYDYDFKKLDMLGWEPWSPELKIVMRKIENPIPMYAQNTKLSNKRIAIPAIEKKLGFDLVAYDWVAPYGNGRHADFFFYLEKRYSSSNDYDSKLTISFSNENDGILKVDANFNAGSQYKLPRYAPETGYSNKLVLMTSQRPDGMWIKGYQPTDSYIFRIRSEIFDGKLIKAIYGKIRGPIQFEPRKELTEVYFTYYLNPDNTRNLEYDPNHNMFSNLTDLERVIYP